MWVVLGKMSWRVFLGVDIIGEGGEGGEEVG